VQWLQVTSRGVVLVDPSTRLVEAAWTAPDNQPVSVCACNGVQLVLAAANRVFYFDILSGTLAVARSKLLFIFFFSFCHKLILVL
jgi:hypothetical protein